MLRASHRPRSYLSSISEGEVVKSTRGSLVSVARIQVAILTSRRDSAMLWLRSFSVSTGAHSLRCLRRVRLTICGLLSASDKPKPKRETSKRFSRPSPVTFARTVKIEQAEPEACMSMRFTLAETSVRLLRCRAANQLNLAPCKDICVIIQPQPPRGPC